MAAEKQHNLKEVAHSISAEEIKKELYKILKEYDLVQSYEEDLERRFKRFVWEQELFNRKLYYNDGTLKGKYICTMYWVGPPTI